MAWFEGLKNYLGGKQPDKRQKQLNEIEKGDPTSAPALPSPESLKKMQDSMQKAFKKTSQLEPEYQKRMEGLARGSQMQFGEAQQNQDAQILNDQETGPRGGVSDEQWQRAQQKMDEILAQQPQLGNQPQNDMYNMDEEVNIDEMNPNQVLDDAKLRALQKMRGSGMPPRGL